jgi:hypothetical protein
MASTVYKGSPQLNLDEMSSGKTAAVILLTGLVVSLLSIVFWVPYARAKVIKKDYSKQEALRREAYTNIRFAAIRFYHFFYGPFLWNRPAPADAGDMGKDAIADYRIRAHREGDVVANPTQVYGSKSVAIVIFQYPDRHRRCGLDGRMRHSGGNSG